MSGGQISRPDASFETVLVTCTLCLIADPLAALQEIRRGLAPGIAAGRWHQRGESTHALSAPA